MVKIYELARERWGIFFNRGRQLILQYKEGEEIGNPILLARDYMGGFDGRLYKGTLYYIYLDEKGEILLRSMEDNRIYKRISLGGGRIQPLGLSVSQGQLAIWYVFRHEGQGNGGQAEENGKSIYCAYAFQSEIEKRVLEGLAADSEAWLWEAGHEDGEMLALAVLSGREHSLYRIEKGMEARKMQAEAVRQEASGKQETAVRQAVGEEEKKDQLGARQEAEMRERLRMEAREELVEKLQEEAQERMHEIMQNVLGEKEKTIEELQETLQKRLEEVNGLRSENRQKMEQIQQKDTQIKRFREMVESAARQYEDLMHVAEQYRDEAIKWRRKFDF